MLKSLLSTLQLRLQLRRDPQTTAEAIPTPRPPAMTR